MEHQDNTHLLVESLNRPIDEIFAAQGRWREGYIQSVLKTAGE